MGIAVSARARHTRSATAVAVALALLLLFADAVVMGGLVALSRWDGGGDGISPFAVCAPFFLAGSAIVTAAALELARRDIRRVD
jgi:hypothetical protein